MGAGEAACELAVVLTERGLGGDLPDLGDRLDRFARDHSPRGKDGRRLAHGWKHFLRAAARELGEKAAPTRAIARRPGRAGLSRPHRPRARQGRAIS